MNNKHSEQALQELYQARKNKLKAPLEHKQEILEHAKQHKASPWRWLNWQSAVAFCCMVVVVGHLSKKPSLDEQPSYTVSHSVNSNNQSVYYMDVDYVSVNQAQKQSPFSAKKTDEHQVYLNSLAKLDNRRQLRGTIKQIDDKLVVAVCQLGEVQISKQIVQQLRQQGLMNDLNKGQEVLLLANQQGWIVGVERVQNGPMCQTIGS